MQALLRLALASLALQLCACQAPAPASTATKKSSSGPFNAFTKSLAQEKKKPFMELMKKLRLSKQATGTKEEKKKATMALDAEIHKVLGPDYKKYRAVTEALKQLHASKKSTSGGVTAAKPPPPPPAVTATPKKKKGKRAGAGPKSAL